MLLGSDEQRNYRSHMDQRDVTLNAGDLYHGEKSMCDGYTMNENLPGRNGWVGRMIPDFESK